MESSILAIIYIIGSVTFIIGLKMLSDPANARKGNLIAAAGMTLAIIGTIFLYSSEGQKLHNHLWIFAGLAVGGVIGTFAARKVQMTAMPELVSLFNGMGGACAALISFIEFDHLLTDPVEPSVGHLLIILAGLIIGVISFSGSIIAWGKLNGKIKDYSFKGQHIVNLFFLFLIIAGAAYMIITMDQGIEPVIFYTILFLAILYGIQFVLPIGGADMPVVISLLNSFTGVAAACGGFLYDNKVMLTGGILVGAA
ncbi:MAG: NAD(P)(+) transhydrogenase (Re/Si-specific) subunit beta, partial [Flavitalea sp.]